MGRFISYNQTSIWSLKNIFFFVFLDTNNRKVTEFSVRDSDSHLVVLYFCYEAMLINEMKWNEIQ